ncbi:hypothetical protein [Paracoccus aestuariivivens]|uniref:Uncharacterized protein n=1 Tax=Paracoccus aestuariivivens TaxID=1820333 RepID=A0A6L6J9I6_9RHOB|nr:hypothetical protein [Paracoccus aestuariivivens]MTH78742.1 hypothetical protein [Paracoccus aestuariivivens]
MQITIWGANTQATVLALPILGIPTIKGDKGDQGEPGEIPEEDRTRIDAAIDVNNNLTAVRAEMQTAHTETVSAAGRVAEDRLATGSDRSATAVDRAQVAADRAQVAADQIAAERARSEAEAFAAAGATAAHFYDTIAIGRATVSDGAQFGVRAGGADGLTRSTVFRRDSETTQSMIVQIIAATEVATEAQRRTELEAAIRPDADFSVINTVPQVGYIYNSALGQVLSNSSYRAMFVAVSEGDVLRLSAGVRGTSTALATFVDSSGRVIDRLNIGSNTETVYEKVILAAPVGASGLWMTTENVAAIFPLAERLVNSQARAREVEPLSEWENVSITWTSGGFYRLDTGAFSSNPNYQYAVVSVTPGEVYRLSNELNGVNLSLALFRDAGDAVLYPYKRGATPAIAFSGQVVVVPPGAATMTLGRNINAVSPFSIERRTGRIGSVPDYVRENLDAVPAMVQAAVEQERQFWTAETLVWASGNIRRSDGVVLVNENYSHAFGECIPGSTMRFSANLYGTGVGLVVWYGVGDTYLSVEGQGSNTAPVEYRDVVLTVPAGAIRYGMTYRNADGANLVPHAEVSTIAPSLTALIDSRILGSGAGGFWSGKDIVWMGTSIPAGETTGLKYPDQVGAALGATVHNIARAGSCLRNGVASARNVVPDDEFGWANANWGIITRSLSMTTAEKQAIIDNWATWRTRFRASSSPPVNLSAAQQADTLNSSWEVRIAPHLGQGRDLWVFDHGVNDAGTADDLLEGEDDTRDRGTFLGASNYLIDLILNDNPRARIFFIGHYTDDDFVRASMVPGQKRVADLWGRPICPLYETLGWSRVRSVTTEGYWQMTGNTGIWMPSGGSIQTLEMNEVWMPDGLHPDRDASGTAVNRIVDALVAWLNVTR